MTLKYELNPQSLKIDVTGELPPEDILVTKHKFICPYGHVTVTPAECTQFLKDAVSGRVSKRKVLMCWDAENPCDFQFLLPADRDMEISGVEVKKGMMIYLVYQVDKHDERHYYWSPFTQDEFEHRIAVTA